MASATPAALGLGGQLGRIAPGFRADLVLVDDAMDVLRSWISPGPWAGDSCSFNRHPACAG